MAIIKGMYVPDHLVDVFEAYLDSSRKPDELEIAVEELRMEQEFRFQGDNDPED